jgi:hypothetical protein
MCERHVDPYEELDQMAANGDIVGVAGAVINMNDRLRPMKQANLFREAIGVAQANGTLTEKLLDMALGLSGELYCRMLVLTMLKVVTFDQANSRPTPPREILMDMEKVALIEDRLILLSKARASIQHVNSLAERGPNRERPGRVVTIEQVNDNGNATAPETGNDHGT